jgi:hypothetical protein
MFEESAKLLVWLVSIILLAVIILPQMIRILREYERTGGTRRTARPARQDKFEATGDHRSANRSVGNQSDCRRGQRRCFARRHEAGNGRPSRVGTGAPRENHKRRRRVSGRGKTRAGSIDDFRATDRPATALLTDDEGNFERA